MRYCNPAQFYLTPAQAHDLNGADALLANVEADAFLTDKAYDAQERSQLITQVFF
ncbi:MAG: hypothetical protein N4J56_004556 [Chroococcidiopsis sp. SAG 2025]|nr:hypothetical protein [Chroococcidiopsis sp. SAG 2025]